MEKEGYESWWWSYDEMGGKKKQEKRQELRRSLRKIRGKTEGVDGGAKTDWEWRPKKGHRAKEKERPRGRKRENRGRLAAEKNKTKKTKRETEQKRKQPATLLPSRKPVFTRMKKGCHPQLSVKSLFCGCSPEIPMSSGRWMLNKVRIRRGRFRIEKGRKTTELGINIQKKICGSFGKIWNERQEKLVADRGLLAEKEKKKGSKN